MTPNFNTSLDSLKRITVPLRVGGRASDEFALFKAFFLRVINLKRGLTLEECLDRVMVVRRREGVYSVIRPNTSDLYNFALEEEYELKNWFLPVASGVVVDVGAYIGKYTLFACKKSSVEKVIAIEPLPLNFVTLAANVKLNKCEEKVIIVNKAIDAVKGVKEM